MGKRKEEEEEEEVIKQLAEEGNVAGITETLIWDLA